MRYSSPCGELILGAVGRYLCLCDWDVPERRSKIDIRVQKRLKAQYAESKSKTLDQAAQELDEYFAGKRTLFDIPIAFSGSSFQNQVWEELLKIPYGTIISYKELAERTDNPKAVRAVATAVGANPISVFVPCHRVIGSNHSLTGYAGGLEAKRMLLDLEQRTFENTHPTLSDLQ